MNKEEEKKPYFCAHCSPNPVFVFSESAVCSLHPGRWEAFPEL